MSATGLVLDITIAVIAVISVVGILLLKWQEDHR